MEGRWIAGQRRKRELTRLEAELSTSGPGQNLEDMAIGVAEIKSPATTPIVKLHIRARPRCAAVSYSGLLQTCEDCVELLVTYVKRIVMTLEALTVIEIQSQGLIDPDGGKMPGWTVVSKPENLGKEASRSLFVISGNYCVIERNGHVDNPASFVDTIAGELASSTISV